MLLVICAVRAEADAVLDGLTGTPERFAVGPFEARARGAVTTVVGGIGPAASATACSAALALGPYDAVVSAGIAGGFAHASGLVVADEIVPADVGVLDGSWRSFADPVRTGSHALATELGAVHAPVLTVSTVTSLEAQRSALLERFPGAGAEAMEGYGIACAATAFGVPCHEVRAISNRVGLRDRDAWDVPGALTALTAAMPVLVDVLEPA